MNRPAHACVSRLGRLVPLAAVLCCAGCDTRCLSWHYHELAADRIAKAKRVAVVSRTRVTQGAARAGTGGEEPGSVIVGELISRGYNVIFLGEVDSRAHRGEGNESRAAEPTTGPAGGVVREAWASGADVEKWYEDARKAGAEMLLEFSTLYGEKTVTDVMSAPIPFVPTRMTTELRREIRQISLCIRAPDDRAVLATVTLRLDRPTRKVHDAVKDLLLGLSMILQRKPPSTLELTGKPGELPSKH